MGRNKAGQKETQKNLTDVKTRPEDKNHFTGVVPGELTSEQLFPTIRQPIKITKYEIKNPKFFKTKTVKDYKYSQVLGAAGPELIPQLNLKEVSDPYDGDTRIAFTNVLLQDPVAAPAARFSIGSIFEDGFDLQFTLASQFNPQTGRQMTPDEINIMLESTRPAYDKILKQIATWKDDKEIEQLAKDLHGVSLAQGKAAGMIQPGFLDLQKGQMPILCEIIPADDLSTPIIDAGLTRKIVAVNLDIDKDEEDENTKDILRADEIVYYVTGIRGLRREAKYHGVSPLEPILQISKALKRYYHLDAPLAMIAAYIGKVLVKVSKDNTDEALQARVVDFMAKLFKSTTWAMAMPDWYEGIDTVQNKVDWPMFDGIEQKLATVQLSALGVPKSAMNREQDLNRDIATIQAIQFVRFIVKPAEEGLKKVLENQLFNPLLAHLAGVPLKQIPLRIEVVKRQSKEGDITKMFDQMAVTKNQDMTTGNLLQNNSQNPIMPIGASGEVEKLQIKAYHKLLKKLDKQ